jgi:surfeit locus 1 family protein
MEMTAYRFRPSLWATLATLALLPVFIFAGSWQLDRAAAKRELREFQIERAKHSPISIGVPRLIEEDEFRLATAQGRYEAQHRVFLDNRVHHGQVGYHVLAPLRIDGGARRLLVNLGWVPAGVDRGVLPAVRLPEGTTTVQGRLRRPAAPGLRLRGDDQEKVSAVWQHLELKRMEGAFGYELQPLVLELDPDALAPQFVRDWPAYGDNWVERHHAYAFQWFALAAALVVVYLAVNTRRVKT